MKENNHGLIIFFLPARGFCNSLFFKGSLKRNKTQSSKPFSSFISWQLKSTPAEPIDSPDDEAGVYQFVGNKPTNPMPDLRRLSQFRWKFSSVSEKSAKCKNRNRLLFCSGVRLWSQSRPFENLTNVGADILNSYSMNCNGIASGGYCSTLTDLIFTLECFSKPNHLSRKVRDSKNISSAVICYTVNTHFCKNESIIVYCQQSWLLEDSYFLGSHQDGALISSILRQMI